jgi:hypothetical protein
MGLFPFAGRAADRGGARGDAYSVLDHGAAGDGATDDSAAFQRAIDAAAGDVVRGRIGGGRVVVPYRPHGYRVSGIRLRSYVELVGVGGQVTLANRSDRPTLIGHGSEAGADGVLRKSRIADLHLQGNPRSGHGIDLVEHADNVIERLRIRAHGGDGISAMKRAGGAKSDGLVVDSVWIDDNRGCGLRFGPNSHYCQVRGASRLSNNDGGNLEVRGASFAMFGGVVGASLGSASVFVAEAHGGGFFATEFEATPSQVRPGALVRLGAPGQGRARGLVFEGCVLTASGNPAPVVLIDAANAENVVIRGGHLDGNSPAEIVGVRVGASSARIVLDTVGFGGNIGKGGFREIVDPAGRATVR